LPFVGNNGAHRRQFHLAVDNRAQPVDAPVGAHRNKVPSPRIVPPRQTRTRNAIPIMKVHSGLTCVIMMFSAQCTVPAFYLDTPPSSPLMR
jgi:hypothetical protein